MIGRLAVLSYGSLIYLLFLGVFLYAGLFIGGLLVPTTLDAGGPESSVLNAVLINVGMLSLFAIQHTIMARHAFKKVWTRIIPPAAERSTFVLATCLLLCLIFWQWRPIDIVAWQIVTPLVRGMLWVVFALGMLTVLYSTFLIDHFGLFGLRQVVDNYKGRPSSAPAFQVRSLYKVVRHPLMLGFMVSFWAAPTMTGGRLLFAAVVSGYVFFGTWIEERSLIATHGEDYLAYKRQVPGIFPWPRKSTPKVVDAAPTVGLAAA